MFGVCVLVIMFACVFFLSYFNSFRVMFVGGYAVRVFLFFVVVLVYIVWICVDFVCKFLYVIVCCFWLLVWLGICCLIRLVGLVL